MNTKKHTALVLFAGSGGLSRGLEQAGFASLGLDVDPLCVEDHRVLAGPAEVADLMAMQPHELRAVWAKHFGEDHPGPDLLATSPPCKGFSGCLPSQMASTDKYQEMNGLGLRGVWLVLEAFAQRPKLFILENVPRMGSARGEGWLDQIRQTLHAYGYTTHMDSHDCGEIGGLAQVRRRLLLVARHRPQVSDFTPWPKPPKKKHKAIRDVLACLPVPLHHGAPSNAEGSPGKVKKGNQAAPTWDGGPLHRPVGCSMLTWLRLALVPEGKDWRSIPAQVTIRHADAPTQEAQPAPNLGPHAHNGPWGVEGWDGAAHTVAGQGSHVTSHWATVADPRTGDKEGTHPGARGVQDWDKPAHTVIGGQRVERNFGCVEEPVTVGLPQNANRHKGGYGVNDADAPHPTITAGRLNAHPVSMAQEVNPQLPFRASRQFSQYGVNAADGPAHAVVGRSKHDVSWASVADVGLGCEPRRGVYGVSDDDGPAPTVIGSAQHDNGAWTRADPRVVQAGMGHEPRTGTLGVTPWDGVSGTIIGHARAEKGNITADPRLTCEVREGAMGVCEWEATFRTAVISRGIPQNGPWQVADVRGLEALVDGYVVGAEVWLRPGLRLDLQSKRPVQMVLLTWNDKKQRWAWHRPLTTLELAVLQGLPAKFDDGSWLALAGRNHEVWREHIGNMVPAPTARAIGEAAVRCLTSGGWLMLGADEVVWVDEDGNNEAPQMDMGDGLALGDDGLCMGGLQ